MFVKVTDSKGNDQFINAVYIRQIHPKGETSILEFSGGKKIKTNLPAQQLAELFNAAMPNALDAILAAEDQNHIDQMAAAAAAAG